MGILSKFKEGVKQQNINRKERQAKGLGFSSNADRITQTQHAKTQAIKRNNNKKRKAELRKQGKEATMTRAEKIQRGVAGLRKEMDSFQGGNSPRGNHVTKTLGVKPKSRKRKAKKKKASKPRQEQNPFGQGFKQTHKLTALRCS